MSLIDRVASRISQHTNCVRAFPCQDCDRVRNSFDGAGCRVLAQAALSACIPDPSVNADDDVRAVRVAIETCGDPTEVIEIVETWFESVFADD